MIARLFAIDSNLHTQVRRFLNYTDYTADVIQDLSLIILTYNNEEKLLRVCLNNEFNFWLFGVLKNQTSNQSSNTNKSYKVSGDYQVKEELQSIENDYNQIEEQQHLTYIHNIIQQELNKLDKNDWYGRRIFEEYMAFKEECLLNNQKFTYEKFSEKLNINKDSLFKQVKKIKLKLKKIINDEL